MTSHPLPPTASSSQPRAGVVYLVGTGPGAADLLTLRAARLIEQAEVVLYDHLVADEIMARLPAQCERYYVGKRQGNHSMPQAEINALLVQLCKSGKVVLRLKGGDPFIFGRGGEELAEIRAAGLQVEVVPGISAANGIAAATGIPLTHRQFAQSLTLVTGHLQDGSCDLDWPALARSEQTLVVYMGLTVLPRVCENLIAHGRAANTPAAVIQKGTTAAQHMVSGTLANIAQRVQAAQLRAPTLIIIGEVVALSEHYQA